MKKATTILLTSVILAGCIAGIPTSLHAQGPIENPELYDSYGGRTDMHMQKGSGFFDLGEINGKYFFVTPEGNAFRAIGLNHSHTLTTDDYDQVTTEMKSMGFNSGDYQGHNWQWDRLPYTQGINLVNICRWQPESVFAFEDVFDPAFVTALDAKVKKIVQPQAENANLICYFFTDIPVWNEEKYGSSWIDFYKSLSEDSPGGTQWKQWKEDNPGAAENEFLPLIARKLYTDAVAILKKYDSNHLIFSDRYLEYTFFDPVVEESVALVDGIAIQPKNFLDFEFFDEVYEKFQLPVFVADHVTSFATEEYSSTMGQVAKNVDKYLEYYSWSVQHIMAKPYMVGYNKCQFQDQYTGTQLKQGLYKENGDPYSYLDSLYDVHTSALDTAYKAPQFDMKESKKKLNDWGDYESLKEEAIERIEKYRKADITLKVLFPDGEIASDIQVEADLLRHDFLWGAVVTEGFVTSPHQERYRKVFKKYFNASGFGVACKPKFRGTERELNMLTKAMPWFKENDIYVRGHTLTWEGYNYLRPEDKAIYDDESLTNLGKGEALLESMGKHFPHAIPRWDVICWDVTNESIGNNLVNDLLPDYNTHAHWFRLADSIRQLHGKDSVTLFANDYQIVSAIMPWALSATKPGYDALGRPALYRALIDEQIAAGAPIEGIGFQSRLKAGMITPDSIYQRLQAFERFNLPYHGTEFEIRDDADRYVYSNAERRLLTEYMMVMYMSHPFVKGFWHWTFADQRSGVDLDYSLFNYDGTAKVNGEIWMDLMDGFFNTSEQLWTDPAGLTTLRGFYGNYNLHAEIADTVYIGHFRIDSTKKEPVTEVMFDWQYSFSGLADSMNYDLGEPITLQLSALSSRGNISSIGFFINGDSIGGTSSDFLEMEYTPVEALKGWNDILFRIKDTAGNQLEIDLSVIFGNTLPDLEVISQPSDTIYTTSTGNEIIFKATTVLGEVDSVIVRYEGHETVFTGESGTFFFNVDTLEAGDYHFIIEVVNSFGKSVEASFDFSVLVTPNELPYIEIITPEDSAVIQYGSEEILSAYASDSDGSIVLVEFLANGNAYYSVSNLPYSTTLNELEIGDYNIVAIATDNREGVSADTVFITVADSTVVDTTTVAASHGSIDNFRFYPNPVGNKLYLSKTGNYEVYSLTGIRVLEARKTDQLEVSSLSPGLYLLRREGRTYKFRKN